MNVYIPKNPSRSTILPIRKLRYHVREWGPEGAPLMVLAHGWMDMSASFQFMVDALQREWHIIAPDWRGYGLSEWPVVDCYYLTDYLGDLDAVLEHYSPNAPVHLVGHSMGGNISTLYAGVRPERIRSFVNLEGLGAPGDEPDKAAKRLATWLGELRNPPELKTYATFEAVVARLQKTNPRLPDARARFLAQHWSRVNADGIHEIQGDPAHKVINPGLYHLEESLAIWRAITAPVLWVATRESEYSKQMEAVPGYAQRLAQIPRIERAWVDDAGHMLHHDQPEVVARLVEDFIVMHA